MLTPFLTLHSKKMAAALSSRALFLAFLLSFALVALLQSHSLMAETTTDPDAAKAPIDCVGACKYRCSKSWKAKMCNKLCTGCCHKCNCVPPGPTASKDVCPCYANLRNPKTGAFKCP